MIEWAERVRRYRANARLSQAGLAELFGVDARTVQRWEAGSTAPPKDIQVVLWRAPVPAIMSASVVGLAELVRSSTEIAFLFDASDRVIASSGSHTGMFRKLNGVDPVGVNWYDYVPDQFKDEVSRQGGRENIYRRGYRTLTGDMRSGSGVCWRVHQSLLVLDAGERVELCFSRRIDPSAFVGGRTVYVYADEIMSS
jgi:hypothetical protein